MAAGRPTAWIYRMRREGKAGALTVPPEVAEQLPAGALFQLKITPEGFLYSPVETTEIDPADVRLPWLEGKSE